MSVFEGRTVDVALAKAASTLGVEPDGLQYEILAGKDGGFGLIRILEEGEGASSAPPAPSAPPMAAQAPESRPEPPRSDDRGDDRRDFNRGGGGGGGRQGGRSNDRRDDRRRREPIPVAPADGPTEVFIHVAEGVELTEIGDATVEGLRGIFEGMGFGLEITVDEDDKAVSADIETSQYGDVLVARDLQLLSAIEHLLDKMVNTGESDERKKIRLDCNGVRKQQDVDLGDQAVELAKRAIDEDRVFKMGPLNPRLRRLVHIALRDLDGVSTQSEGEGAFRRVCIIPDGLE